MRGINHMRTRYLHVTDAAKDTETRVLAHFTRLLRMALRLQLLTEQEGIMSNTAEIVHSFMEAVESGNFTRARTFLDDQLSFVGPFDKFDRAEPYLEALQKLHPIVEQMKIVKLLANGEDAAVLCEMTTKTPIGTVPIAEFHQVKAGKIAAIRVLFDPRPFAAMFAK
jgi:hypothetical protein